MTFVTTLNAIRAHQPSAQFWSQLLFNLGKTEADDEPLPLLTVLDSNGFHDALWCLRALEDHDSDIRLFAVWCARRVQHLLKDQSTVSQLDVVERFARGKATLAEFDKARTAIKRAHTVADDGVYAATAVAITTDTYATAAAAAADAVAAGASSATSRATAVIADADADAAVAAAVAAAADAVATSAVSYAAADDAATDARSAADSADSATYIAADATAERHSERRAQEARFRQMLKDGKWVGATFCNAKHPDAVIS
jgi:hypothetical protein